MGGPWQVVNPAEMSSFVTGVIVTGTAAGDTGHLVKQQHAGWREGFWGRPRGTEARAGSSRSHRERA